jgi:dsRNA-specific ribonuclease
MVEALTSPGAGKIYDYERLEFYGDSVISLLVIVELFLKMDYNHKENWLDHERVNRVSNLNFS